MYPLRESTGKFSAHGLGRKSDMNSDFDGSLNSVSLWESYLILLSLSFLIHKVRLIRYTSYDCSKN